MASAVLPPKYPGGAGEGGGGTLPSIKEVTPPEPPRTTPLPTLRLIILGLAVLADAFSVTIVYPFAPFLVRDLMHIPEWRQNEVGYYSGLVASCFTLGSMFGSPLWGALSDQIGRRPVILVGLFGDFIFINFFGMASNIVTALLFRFLHGLSSGNIAVAKTYLADITDASNESVAFGLIGLTFGVGVVIGPVIGGFLSRPSAHLPQYFPPNSFFDRHPYLLPCSIVSLYVFVDLIFAYFFLDESRPKFSTEAGNEAYQSYEAYENVPSREEGLPMDISAQEEVLSVVPSEATSVRELEKQFLDRNLLETFERQAGVTPRMSQGLFSHVPGTSYDRSFDAARTPLLSRSHTRSMYGGRSPSVRSRGRGTRDERDREWDERSSWSFRDSYNDRATPVLSEILLEPEEEDIHRKNRPLSSSHQSLSRSVEKSIPEKDEEQDDEEEGDKNSVQGQNMMEDESWLSEEYVRSHGASSWVSQRKGSESSSFMNYGLSGSFGATTANILSPSFRSKTPKFVDQLRWVGDDSKSVIPESLVEEASLFSPEEGSVLPEPTFATIENKTFSRVLIIAVLISFTLLAGDEVIPIWASTQPAFGGLGFSSTDIGCVQAISGMTTIFVALYIFPVIARTYGVVKTIRIGLVVGSINYLLPAIATSFGWSRKDSAAWTCYAVFDIFLAFFEQCCWAGIALIVKNSVHPSSVGIALGLAQGLQSAGFAAGPVIGGSLFAAFISLPLPFPLSYGRTFFYLESCLLFIIYLVTLTLPPWPWKIETHRD
eukprot:jgi/Galph1/5189/GphlegSOOS_G3855.1